MRAERRIPAVAVPVGLLLSVVALTACSGHGKTKGALPSGVTTGTKAGATRSALPAGEEPTPVMGNCSIITPAAVTKAFGGTIATFSETVTGTGSPQCSFTLHKAALGDPLTVVVNKHTSETAADFATARKLAVTQGATAVTGVGDDAYYVQSQATIRFIRRQSTVSIQATLKAGSGSATIADVMSADLTKLAKAIVPSL